MSATIFERMMGGQWIYNLISLVEVFSAMHLRRSNKINFTKSEIGLVCPFFNEIRIILYNTLFVVVFSHFFKASEILPIHIRRDFFIPPKRSGLYDITWKVNRYMYQIWRQI